MMNRLFTFLILPLAALFSFKSFAQGEHFNCGTSEKMRELYKQNPSIEDDIARLIQNSRTNKSNKSATDTLLIPIVFHIIHQYGSENIPDANVYDQIKVLNRDYLALNADTSEVIAAFDTMIGKAYIQFQLASKDPWGNCTNGIEHIYSHESTQGDDNSKLSGWHRSRYLNVWVVASMRDGVAGYAFYPSDGIDFSVDGIIILDDYIGRLAPSSENSSRALTHEIGHYLALPHPWGNNNDPMVVCGDDGILDTPVTKGYNYCPANANASKICDPDVIATGYIGTAENYQNYMDYSYCSFMFTPDQVDLMRSSLTVGEAQRPDLTTDSVHELAGVAPYVSALSPPLCTPVADFYAPDAGRFICQGASVTFYDASWRAAVASRVWTFEGGTPATSTSATQSVTYDTPGYKKVTLSVTNANGTNSVVKENYVYVSPLWADFTGPYSNNLESDNALWFLVHNPENLSNKFSLNYGHGYSLSKCYKLNNFKDISAALPYTADWYHNRRLGGSKGVLITPSFDLRNTTGVSVSFKFAYASNATIAADIKEGFKVYYSRNCGQSWSPVSGTSITGTSTVSVPGGFVSGANVLTSGFAGYTDFAPATNDQWKTCSFNYNPTSLDNEVRFKIEFTASDLSSNFYVDNFNVAGTLGLFSNDIDDLELMIYPNPLSSQQSINVSYFAGENPVELILRDAQGKVVCSEKISITNSKVEHTLEAGKPLSASCYFLEVKSGGFSSVKKVVVL